MDDRGRNVQYLETIFERSADGLMICDATGKILKLNQSAEKLNGIKAEDVLGREVATLVKEGHLDRSATQEVLETRRQVSVVQLTPKSGYTLLVTGTPVFDDNHDIAFVVVNERDISLIENMKQEREQVVKQFTAKVPMARLAEIEDIVDVTVFMCSSGSDYMTGQAINITGGREMH